MSELVFSSMLVAGIAGTTVVTLLFLLEWLNRGASGVVVASTIPFLL